MIKDFLVKTEKRSFLQKELTPDCLFFTIQSNTQNDAFELHIKKREIGKFL